MTAQKANNGSTVSALAAQEQQMAKAPTENIAQFLERQKPAIQAALPNNLDVDRFTRIVLTTIRTNPRLLNCDPMSIIAATMQSAQLGLEPGSGLGEAFIIPYGNQATFQMGYKGLTKLVHNSGAVSALYAEAVYEGDLFDVQMGTEPRIVHKPNFDVERGTQDTLTHVYAVAKMKDGETQFTVMSKDEILKHAMRYSKAYQKKDSPWQDKFGWVEMAKKTVVLRLCKMLPLTAEVSRAIAADNTVRREISVDMTSLPDADLEKVSPEALGAVEAEEAEEIVEAEIVEDEPVDKSMGQQKLST